MEVKHNKLSTQLYKKPTVKRQLLYYTSRHPKSQKNIPYSQCLRLQIICFHEESFNLHAQGLRTSAFGLRPSNSRRDDLLVRTKRRDTGGVPLVATFHTNIFNLNLILNRKISILHTDPKLKCIVPETPFATFRKQTNIGRFLCPSTISGTPNRGRCQACQCIIAASEVKSYASQFTVKSSQTSHSKTPNIPPYIMPLVGL